MTSTIFRNDLLADKVCIVTGGGTGIGATVAKEFGQLGANVVIASRKQENIDIAAQGLSRVVGREVTGLTCDIRNRDHVQRLYEQVLEKYGRVDVLVNNGGGQFFAPAETITPNGWDAVVATNLTGTWNMTRAAHDAWMGKHGGCVLNITMLTRRTFPGMAHSVSARAGVEAMTRTLAIEWASKRIRLNCIAPGIVASSGLKRYPAGLGVMNQMQQYIPMKRPASCDEVAWMVAYLASEAGAYITGQTLTIDGGKELWGDWWPIATPKDMPDVEIPPEPWELPEDEA
jgi:NAD(P)-dependent dehydrogenase (short-subunit alcohol dehydrogenase family)